jgi:hypothetical protein
VAARVRLIHCQGQLRWVGNRRAVSIRLSRAPGQFVSAANMPEHCSVSEGINTECYAESDRDDCAKELLSLANNADKAVISFAVYRSQRDVLRGKCSAALAKATPR